jgi:hypothetical protein
MARKRCKNNQIEYERFLLVRVDRCGGRVVVGHRLAEDGEGLSEAVPGW